MGAARASGGMPIPFPIYNRKIFLSQLSLKPFGAWVAGPCSPHPIDIDHTHSPPPPPSGLGWHTLSLRVTLAHPTSLPAVHPPFLLTPIPVPLRMHTGGTVGTVFGRLF